MLLKFFYSLVFLISINSIAAPHHHYSVPNPWRRPSPEFLQRQEDWNNYLAEESEKMESYYPIHAIFYMYENPNPPPGTGFENVLMKIGVHKYHNHPTGYGTATSLSSHFEKLFVKSFFRDEFMGAIQKVSLSWKVIMYKRYKAQDIRDRLSRITFPEVVNDRLKLELSWYQLDALTEEEVGRAFKQEYETNRWPPRELQERFSEFLIKSPVDQARLIMRVLYSEDSSLGASLIINNPFVIDRIVTQAALKAELVNALYDHFGYYSNIPAIFKTKPLALLFEKLSQTDPENAGFYRKSAGSMGFQLTQEREDYVKASFVRRVCMFILNALPQ